jgi:hypothetical protein
LPRHDVVQTDIAEIGVGMLEQHLPSSLIGSRCFRSGQARG